MKILITNNTLDGFGGTECYVRDVAEFMLNKEHVVIAYSQRNGAVAETLRRMGVHVIDNLEDLHLMPDIIHGHHHLDATAAMMKLPLVPAIFFTHGILPWEESPPPCLRQIRRYICISEITKNGLLARGGCSEDLLTILPNFVSSRRFTQKRDIERAKNRNSLKTLALGNYKPRELEAIKQACKDIGASYNEIGAWSANGNQGDIEKILCEYDVVFAYGRSAMESLYSGCDVILTHGTGTGELVTDDNFDQLRSKNFGFTTCQEVKGLSRIKTFLQDADKRRTNASSCLSENKRNLLDSSRILEQLEHIYEEVIDDWTIANRGLAETLDSMHSFNSISKYLSRLQKERLEEKCFTPTPQSEIQILRTTLEGIAHEARIEAEQARLDAEQARIEAANSKQQLHQAQEDLEYYFLQNRQKDEKLHWLRNQRKLLMMIASAHAQLQRRVMAMWGRILSA